MKAEKICVSLETAKRLHEAGIVVDSYFHWVGSKFSARKPILTFNNIMPEAFTYCEQYRMGLFKYPAPTAEELLAILPKKIEYDGLPFKMEITESETHPSEYLLWYLYRPTKIYMSVNGNRLCEIIAKMLIRLKKEAGYELDK